MWISDKNTLSKNTNMAFLAAEDRFGPDLSRCRQGEPNPCTYTPDSGGVASGGKITSGTFGYHRPVQHDPPSHFAASASPVIAATLKELEGNSLQHLRETSAPNACTYSPVMEGQFPQVYTTKEILAERKRASLQRKLAKNGDPMTPQEPHLALGPGSYETNQEVITTPLTFAHEKRHGILDNTAALGRVGCSPGPGIYRVESSTASSSASTVASASYRSKHAAAFITRVRSDSHLHQQQKKDAAAYSKELVKSYKELGASVQRLGRSLASPELREQTFQRFGKDPTALESYRRGPGTYDSTFKMINDTKSDDCTRNDWCQLSPLPNIGRKPTSSFGRVAGRDLLRSMIAAGHASADIIGPGIYDAYSSSFVIPTHNVGYKQELHSKTRLRNTRRVHSADEAGLSNKEMWKAMRHGPTLP